MLLMAKRSDQSVKVVPINIKLIRLPIEVQCLSMNMAPPALPLTRENFLIKVIVWADFHLLMDYVMTY